jgi:hypothetical protein
MRLSGIVFLVVGGVVAFFSWYLQNKNGSKMTLFLVVGLAMAVFGAIRMYLDRGAPKHEAEMRASLDKMTQHHHFNEIPRVCSTCQTKNNPKARFCGHCGNKL